MFLLFRSHSTAFLNELKNQKRDGALQKYLLTQFQRSHPATRQTASHSTSQDELNHQEEALAKILLTADDPYPYLIRLIQMTPKLKNGSTLTP